MKKIAIIAAAVAALFLLVSCNKEPLMTLETKPTKVTVDITVADLAPETKALKADWEDGDKLNIWFNGVSAPNYNYWKQAPHLVLTRMSGTWVSSEVDEALLSASGTFNVIYESSNSLFVSAINNDRVYFPDGTSFQFSGHTTITKTVNVPIVCKRKAVPYSYDSGTKKISGTISSWDRSSRLQVVVSGLPYVADRYALSFDTDRVYSFDCLFYYSGDISESGIATCNAMLDNSSNKWMGGLSNADGTAFYFQEPKYSTATDYTVYLVDKVEKKVYSFTKNATIAKDYSTFTGIKIPFSSFTNVTSTYPLD
jgi:hypothetical protein